MKLDIKKNISLSAYTTLHVGGVADYFVEVSSVEEMKAALQYAHEHTAVPPLILGGGSNLLISDEGYRGVVIKNNIKRISYDDISDTQVVLTSGSGELLDEVVQDSVEKGYWGLENLSSIPGTVGATPIQNVGAYGVEVSSLIEVVSAVHAETFELRTFSLDQCRFGYRDSFFKTEEGRQWVVTSVSYTLSKVAMPKLEYGSLVELKEQEIITPADVRRKVKEIRSGKFPDWHVVGTAGSFFKNPIVEQTEYEALVKKYPELPGFPLPNQKVKLSLGWMLDKICDLRGHCEGEICLYKNQALVLTNTGDSAEAIVVFQKKVIDAVKIKTGVTIEPEVTFVM